jgi:hypothetical protein
MENRGFLYLSAEKYDLQISLYFQSNKVPKQLLKKEIYRQLKN